ncbi:MAG TPA: sigma-70 family RNA polymerase sigma factor [Anaerolineales bacterium]|jgi:RNA polymerase sigma-70 factor (ECF subfamily)|nr:sigma-70 family RNA polymerase sigma factor [Anaerolineales bacterium]
MSELAVLLKAARNLDQNALATIFDLYSSSLYKFISRLLHDPVQTDQMVADVFEKLVADLSNGKGPRTNLRLYLYQTAHHLIVERFREMHPHSHLEVAIRSLEKDKAAPQIDERVTMEALLASMNTDLSEDQRLVIILRFLEDFSLKETAEIIGKDVNNVKVIQNRGIAKLKKAMGMQVEDE